MEKKMDLRKALQKKKELEEEINELSRELIAKKEIFLGKVSSRTKAQIIEALERALEESSAPLLDLTLLWEDEDSGGSWNEPLYFLGSRKALREHLEEIAKSLSREEEIRGKKFWAGLRWGKPELLDLLES